MTEVLLNYGVLGVAVIALGTFISKLMKSHKEERKEWRDAMVEETKGNRESQKNLSDSLNNNTIVMEKIKTLIESKQ